MHALLVLCVGIGNIAIVYIDMLYVKIVATPESGPVTV